MNERIMHATRKISEPGPVITISRDCGCSASLLADNLNSQINQRITDPELKWRWVNKEILKLASDELKMQQDDFKRIVDGADKNFMDEIVYSFTDKYYVTNTKARKMIEEVVRNLAIRGRAIIIGRGSEVLSQGIPRSLHVRLFAPMEWKIKAMCLRSNITEAEAEKLVIQVDKQRTKFKEYYLDKNQPRFLYDAEFNCARIGQNEIVGLILKIANYRSLLI